MPRKKYVRKNRPKRSYRRKQKRGNKLQMSGISVPSRHSLIPLSRRGVLKYSQTFGLTCGTAGVFGTDQVMRLNSLYDPDFTGGGHQPYLYDTMTAQYANYRVYAASVKIINSTIGASSDVVLAARFGTNSASTALVGQTVDRATETSSAAIQYLSPSGNKRVSTMKMYFPMHKIFGVSKYTYDSDDNYQALYNTSPTQNAWLFLAAGSPSGTSSTACTLQIIINYYCKFFNRVDQAQS